MKAKFVFDADPDQIGLLVWPVGWVSKRPKKDTLAKKSSVSHHVNCVSDGLSGPHPFQQYVSQKANEILVRIRFLFWTKCHKWPKMDMSTGPVPGQIRTFDFQNFLLGQFFVQNFKGFPTHVMGNVVRWPTRSKKVKNVLDMWSLWMQVDPEPTRQTGDLENWRHLERA